MKKNLFALIALLTFICQAQTGNLHGKIEDKEYAGNPLPFADVYIKGSTKGATTDFEGKYTIENIEPGFYTLVISFIGYKTKEIENIEIKAGQTTTHNDELGADAAALEEVIVEGTTAVKESEKALLIEQKKAEVIKESIGAEQMKKLAVSDAAAATSKISGVAKSEASGDVYIRGLGDRYLSTTLNGLPIPSDNIENKNINLSLFPANIIQNVGISKTYSTNKYADQASGNVDIIPKEHSGSKAKYSISTTLGANSTALSGDFKRSRNVDDTKFGFYKSNLTLREALTQQSWNTVSENSPVNAGIAITGGGKIGNKVSLFGAVSHSTSSNDQRGIFKKIVQNQVTDTFNDRITYRTKVVTSALFNGSAKIAKGQKLKLTSLFINNLVDQVIEAGRDGTGYEQEEEADNPGSNQFIRFQNAKQTKIGIVQLSGDHWITDYDKADWAIGGNLVNADEPNRIRNELNIYDENENFFQDDILQQGKTSQKIEDKELNAILNYSHEFLNESDNKIKINTGGNYRFKKRDFEYAIEYFDFTQDNGFSVTSLDNLDEGLNSANLEAGLLEIGVNPQRDTYEAELKVAAGYLSADFGFGNFSGSIGARYEIDEINLPFWDVQNTAVGSENSLFSDYENILPSINLKYSFNDEKMFVRFAGSKTFTLPEFKELAPFQYTVATGRPVQGNPELLPSENYNFDLKYEFFPTSSQLLSATVFHKIINDPINKALERGGVEAFSFFNTSDQAVITGIELEAKMNILELENTAKISTLFNLTRMWHKQDLRAADPENGINDEFRYGDTTEIGLQGASDWIFNGSLTYSNNRESDLSVTLSGNYASDKIFALGGTTQATVFDILYDNEIVEEGFFTLDCIISKDLVKGLKMRLIAQNLIDPEIKRTQVIDDAETNQAIKKATVLSYTKGRTFNVNLSYNF